MAVELHTPVFLMRVVLVLTVLRHILEAGALTPIAQSRVASLELLSLCLRDAQLMQQRLDLVTDGVSVLSSCGQAVEELRMASA